MSAAFPVPTMPAPPVGVVGLGQLGGSLAAALAAGGRPVAGWDVDPAAREAAAARGVQITRELSGVVVLAVPLPALATALDELTIDPDATVTDVGSVKVPVLEILGDGLRHPLRRRPPDGRHRALRARAPPIPACSPARAGRSASTPAPTCTAGCGSPRWRSPWAPRSSR